MSNESSAHYPTDARRPVERDAQGHPAFSENLSAGGHSTADRIRSKTRRASAPDHMHDLSISSEKHQYVD